MFNFTYIKDMLSIGTIKRTTVLLLFLIITSETSAAAFCALRDPVDSILNLFPDYTSSRSLVKDVSANAKKILQKSLP